MTSKKKRATSKPKRISSKQKTTRKKSKTITKSATKKAKVKTKKSNNSQTKKSQKTNNYSQASLASFFKRSKKKKTIRSKKQKIIRAVTQAVLILTILGFGTWLFWGLPLPTKLATNEFPVSTKLFDRNGELLFEIYADRKSTPIDLEEIPDVVKKATISIEDKDFYRHYGISITGIVRAAYKSLFKQKLEGGSTLTQQLVKNSLLTPERTIKRKLREFALTIVVETIYTKDQILEIYLNQIPYGSTAYGIGAAAELYFDKPAQELTLAEASLLAGLPAAPTRFSPFGARPELAKGRQNAVLRRMVEDGHITQERMDEVFEENLNFAKAEVPVAPHFSLWIKDQLAEKYGDAVVEQGGLRVTTTLDLDLQNFAQQTVASEVADLSHLNVGNGAALVTKPSTGEILAMVGSKDFFAEDEDGKVNIIFRQRQPGSSIKPLNYALALKDEKITASTPLADVPTCFSVAGQRSYCPRNYTGNFRGAAQTRYALANSYNIPAVRVLALNGIENFINFATDIGITTFTDPSQYGLSLTLGGGEVRPYDMATAFGVLANQGIRVDPIAILEVRDWKNNVLEEINIDEIEGEGDRVLSPDVPFIISHILSDNGARSAAFGSNSELRIRDHPEASVKTGTTNDLRDNWTIGYTSDAVVVVWVGNNDNKPMSGAVSGLSGASPIWNKIMNEVLNKAESGEYGKNDGHSAPVQPDNVVGITVCSDTGNRANSEPNCPTRFEYFMDTAIGARLESGIRDLEIEKINGSLAKNDLPPDQKEFQSHLYVLDPLGTLICLDCIIPEWPATIGYPLPSRKTDTAKPE